MSQVSRTWLKGRRTWNSGLTLGSDRAQGITGFELRVSRGPECAIRVLSYTGFFLTTEHSSGVGLILVIAIK